MELKRAHAEPFWMRRSGWLFLVVVLVVSSVDYWLDQLLIHQGWSRWYLLAMSDVVTGLVAGGLFLYVARHEEARRERMRERMRTVAELNHHIRNALEVIKLCGAQTLSSFDARQLQLIKESADRIEWALREVLPKYPAANALSRRQPSVGFAAVASPASQLKAFSESGYGESARNRGTRTH